ncbi:MAG: ABC transporter substrate-binding protein [Clostridia bacterium]|nr:ABC transporter substrate-binding protein [Clostridia bacterium]
MAVADVVRSGRRALLALVAVAGLLLAACGGGGGAPETGGGASEAGSESTGPQYADEIRIGWSEGKTLDPAYFSLINDYAIAKQIYSGLVQYKMGTTEIVPDLAESWDVSPDGLTYTFHLRHGVKWQKGYGELTAQDVVQHFQRIMDPATASPFAGTLDDVASVEAPDPYTVVFHLKQPSAFFLDQVVAFREGFIANPKAVQDEGQDYGRMPVGTGPYELKEWVPGQYILLEANPDYYGGAPKTKYVRFVHIPDESARQIALQNGEIDVFWNASDPKMIQSFSNDPNYQVYQVNSTGIAVLELNPKAKPLDDVRVRQAMAYAIDYKAITDGVRGGLAVKLNTIIPVGMFGAAPDIQPVYDYDPQKAKELLREAGYPNGFQTSANVLNSGYAPDMFSVIQSNFRDVGIDMQINLVDSPTWQKTLTEANVPISVLLTTRMEPDQILSQFFYGPVCSPKGNNFPCYKGVDDLIAQARAELDDQKRADLYRQIQIKFNQDLPAIPLISNKNVDIVSKRVQGYVKGLAYDADLTHVVVERGR